MLFWGYLHENGSIEVKKYFDFRDLYAAKERSYVKRVFQEFEADSSQEAYDIIKNQVDKK